MADTPPDAQTHLAKRVARLRLERGLSIDELADRASLGRVELDRILRAEAQVGADVVLLLSAALNVDPGALLNGITWVRDGKGGSEYRVNDPEGD